MKLKRVTPVPSRLSLFFTFLLLNKTTEHFKGGPSLFFFLFFLFSFISIWEIDWFLFSLSLISRSSSKNKRKTIYIQNMDQHSGKEMTQQIYKVNTHTLHTLHTHIQSALFLSTPFFFIKRAENRRESSKKLLVIKIKVGQLNVSQTTTTTISFNHSFVCLFDWLFDS